MKKIKRLLSKFFYDFIMFFYRIYNYLMLYINNKNIQSQYMDINSYKHSTTSELCTSKLFNKPFYYFWCNKLKEQVRFHRKQWEFVYICQTLYELGLLSEGKKGVVFGCGKEPLISLFASLGCTILATDCSEDCYDYEAWLNTEQHIKSDVKELNIKNICPEDLFSEKVTYKEVDMNNIPADLVGYDFCWSAGSLEHIGSMSKSIEFIKNSLKTLKSKGVAIHTTEFNLSSNEDTIDRENLVLFRKKDIINLIQDLESEGHYVYPLNLDTGSTILDKFVDRIPYYRADIHLKLKCEGYDITSIGLIIVKK